MDPGVGVIGGGGPNSWAIPDDDEVEMMNNKEVEEMENGEEEENAAKLPKRTKGKTCRMCKCGRKFTSKQETKFAITLTRSTAVYIMVTIVLKSWKILPIIL